MRFGERPLSVRQVRGGLRPALLARARAVRARAVHHAWMTVDTTHSCEQLDAEAEAGKLALLVTRKDL